MKNGKSFLLEKIVGYRTNGFETLAHLHAKHIDDLSKIMEEFAEETLKDVVSRLNKGETVYMSNAELSLKKMRKKTIK